MNDYKSRLRSSPRQVPQEDSLLFSNMATDDFFTDFPAFSNGPSPRKTRNIGFLSSPHKSGHFLRTPSPVRKLQHFLGSPKRSPQNELPGTPSPHKATSATDLFGNKSLLDNLDVPEDWDENFLSNFQDDWLMGLGSEDLESLAKSPLKSPGRGQTFLPNNVKSMSPSVSPFKSPLLTSSPKHSGSRSFSLGKTPAVTGSRPITRQRKLFLLSPEKEIPAKPSDGSNGISWNAPLPFSSSLDVSSSSSALSDGFETTSPLHSISSYLKNFDDEEVQEDMPVMPPAGWTSKSGKWPLSQTGKNGGKFSAKLKREKKSVAPALKQAAPQTCHRSVNFPAAAEGSQGIIGKRLKMEPQFTLLRPHTELHTHQISLRTAPVTPPNKIKISRDFSQIQTLPSKEQLRIVRNRFTETLNKAVERVIEREKSKRPQHPLKAIGKIPIMDINMQSSSSQFITPGLSLPLPSSFPPHPGIPQAVIAVKPPSSKRRRH